MRRIIKRILACECVAVIHLRWLKGGPANEGPQQCNATEDTICQLATELCLGKGNPHTISNI